MWMDGLTLLCKWYHSIWPNRQQGDVSEKWSNFLSSIIIPICLPLCADFFYNNNHITHTLQVYLLTPENQIGWDITFNNMHLIYTSPHHIEFDFYCTTFFRLWLITPHCMKISVRRWTTDWLTNKKNPDPWNRNLVNCANNNNNANACLSTLAHCFYVKF